MSLPILVIGAGGHGSVIAETLMTAGVEVLGFLDSNSAFYGNQVLSRPILGTEELLKFYPPEKVAIAIGVGSIKTTERRWEIFEKFCALGYQLPVIKHPSSLVSPTVRLENGVQLLAGSILQTQVKVGVNTICNTGVIVEHDCEIGRHCHLAPGVVLSASVKIGEGSHIGTGAVIIQGISVGARVTVGAGAVVIRNIEDGEIVMGNPARTRDDCR